MKKAWILYHTLFFVLLYFLLQPVKLRGAEKLAQRDFQPVAEPLDQIDGNLPAFGVKHTIHAGRGNARPVGKLIGLDAAFCAKLLKTVGYCVLDCHINHLRDSIQNLSQMRFRSCVNLENVL